MLARGGQPSGPIPLRRLAASLRSCCSRIFAGTCFGTACEPRSRSDHASPASFSATFRYQFAATPAWLIRPPSDVGFRLIDRINSTRGICIPSQRCSCTAGRSVLSIASSPHAVEGTSTSMLFVRGISRHGMRSYPWIVAGRSWTFIPASGIRPWGKPCAAQPGGLATPLLPWVSPVSGMRTLDSAR
jgi:hypothetical protein